MQIGLICKRTFDIEHFGRTRFRPNIIGGDIMRSLSSKVAIFNKRINRMIKYSGDNLESIDTARQGLKMVYGSEQAEPHAYLKGLSPEKRTQLESVVDAYLRNPESMVSTFKAMQNKGFSTLVGNNNMDSNKAFQLIKVLKAKEWSKIKELNEGGSDDALDNVDYMIDSGMTSAGIKKVMSNYIMTADKFDSFRWYTDKVAEGFSKGDSVDTIIQRLNAQLK